MGPQPSSVASLLQFVAVLTLCLVVLCGIAAGDADVEAVNVTGPGVVEDEGNQPLVATWRPVTVTVTAAPASPPTRVCVYANGNEDATTLGCEVIRDNGSQTVQTPAEAWPATQSGQASVVAIATAPNGSEVGRLEQPVTLFEPDDTPASTNVDPLAAVTETTTADPSTAVDGEQLSAPFAAGKQLAESAATTRDGRQRRGGLAVDAVDTMEVVQSDTERLAPGTSGRHVGLPLVPLAAPVRWLVAAALLAGIVLGAAGTALAGRFSPADPPARPSSRSEPVSTWESADPEVERIHQLLAANGGCLPQSELVARTDWSKAKVSRLLASMAEDDQIRKVRLGRENLVVHPDADPPEQPPAE